MSQTESRKLYMLTFAYDREGNGCGGLTSSKHEQ